MRPAVALLAAGLAIAVALAAAARADAQPDSPGFDAVVGLGPFDALEVATPIRVEVVCGAAPRLAVRSDPPILGARYLDARLEPAEQGTGPNTLHLHFRRDFDRHVHPDQVSVTLTTDRPLARLAATTGARLSVPACAVSPERLALRVETNARAQVGGRTTALDLVVDSGGVLNALDGGRGFWPAQVRLTAGPRARVGLCGAQAVKTLRRAADAVVLTDC